ncbi:dephospho-CoA kinase [Paraferrimonas sedimenticola]|uniref:Dephospho-CoA kinase n=1 Tax=Paraferrimonas sedimenticola TaxID=375674 RepID=A0AA37W280_9GAMM|nr:dephospho-CoA kinase [Paraferrimonas sedimenticola]GLP97467.1 dephospho-CoA kinase [Paraferrimonas sedimenticola]
MADYIIGLTGGIGSGKTTVANCFAKKGIVLVDADLIARDMVAPGSPGLEAIIEHFGAEVLANDGTLDRAKLRQKVFDNDAERTWLNGLLHPMIRKHMLRQAREAESEYAIMVVPLLIENSLNQMVNRILVVDVSPETQIERTMARDEVSHEHVENILKAQASRDERLTFADDVVNNEQSLPELQQQVDQLHESYLKLAKQYQLTQE